MKKIRNIQAFASERCEIDGINLVYAFTSHHGAADFVAQNDDRERKCLTRLQARTLVRRTEILGVGDNVGVNCFVIPDNRASQASTQSACQAVIDCEIEAEMLPRGACRKAVNLY
jgi:hypothetical protein